MFSDKKNEQSAILERNIIAKKTTIVGDIKSEGDFRIDGLLEGAITTLGRVVIGATGVVKGDIKCSNADIEGRFSGKLAVTQLLSLKKTADVKGEVVIKKLLVEPGAIFNATCVMKSGVKDLLKDENARSKKIAQ
ncbi:MAG: polymer-forming cytoskeletal protein [Flavobacteriaceae bacterium]|nr:polymer-forming cytoskeletal protein [Flavobacteriaceae bacterium]